jgi:heme/copper-type cytochrome/quinol oxidase subunit 2
VVIGVLIALAVHLVKTAVRPAANVATAGVAAPVLSTVEDGISVSLALVALLIPALVLVFVAIIAWAAFRLLRRRRRRRKEQLRETQPEGHG